MKTTSMFERKSRKTESLNVQQHKKATGFPGSPEEHFSPIHIRPGD